MGENINLTSKIRLKTNPIHSNSMCLVREKRSKLFLAQSKGISIYDLTSQTFEEMRMNEGNNGLLTCLTLSDDLIFFCFGMKVLACGSNGKILYESDTYIAVDKIDAIHVYGYQLWLVAGNMVNEFLIGGVQLSNKQSRITPSPAQKIQDINSQILDVKINHSLLVKLQAEKPFLLLLKNNSQIETAHKKDAALLTTDSPPTYGYLYPSEQNASRYLVGTMSGEVLYIEVERRKIRKLWSLKENSKGRVNCIVEVKNGFIVFRESSYELWNGNRQLLGKEELNEKVMSAIYLPEEESFFYGSASGQVVEMYNYEKMMKLSKERNEAAERVKIIKEIEELNRLKAELKMKADKLGVNKEASSGKSVKIATNLNLDYVNLCYSLEVTSQKPIIRLVIKGDIRLLEEGEKIHFQGKQNENNQVYTLRTEEKKTVTAKFKYEERYHQNEKLMLTVFNDLEGKLIATSLIVDLKSLSLHQRVEAKLYDRKAAHNLLRISGQFKYFQMTAWLSCIFSDFGSPSLEQEYIELCYESLVTKNKVFIQFKDRECSFLSEAPSPLTTIKKAIFEKSKEKHLSLNYDTKTSLAAINNLLQTIAPKIKQLETNKKEFDLLPALQELSNEPLSADLLQILNRAEQIRSKYAENGREYEQMKSAIKDFFLNYRALNNKEVSSYQLDELTRSLQHFNPQKIVKLIEQ